MGTSIGTRNRSLKMPPEWAKPEGQAPSDFFSMFENSYGEQWVFLHRGDELLLAGFDMDWEVRRVKGKVLDGVTNGSAIDLMATAGVHFNVNMHLAERMWLAGCFLEAAERMQAWRNHPSTKR
jgi:hypothetical protein